MDDSNIRPADTAHPARRRAWNRIVAPLVLACLLGALASGLALAQQPGDLGGKVRSGNEVTIPSSETVPGNIYVFAGTTTVDGTINGDLVAFGGFVVLNGTVKGDVVAAGGTVRIAGPVGQDVRLAGGQVSIQDAVTGDALVAGGQFDVTTAGKVGGDVILSAGRATIDGSVAGSVTGAAASYEQRGTVTGTSSVTVSQNVVTEPTPADRVLETVRHFVAVLLVGAVLAWLVRRVLTRAETTVRRDAVRSGGWGIIALIGFVGLVIVIPVLGVLLAILLALLGFGDLAAFVAFLAILAMLAIVLAFAFLIGFVVDAVVGLALGRLLLDRGGTTATAAATDRRPGPDRGDVVRLLGLMAVGVLIIVVLGAIPVVGGIVNLVVTLLGLGALLLVARRSGRPAEGDYAMTAPD